MSTRVQWPIARPHNILISFFAQHTRRGGSVGRTPERAVKGRDLARRYARGFIPRLIPMMNAKQWRTLNKRLDEIRALGAVERQVVTLEASLILGLQPSVEIARRRIAYAKLVRSRYCPPRKLPVDDLIDRLTALVSIPELKVRARSGPRLSEVRSLLEDLVERRLKPPHNVSVQGRMVAASNASLAAHLGCSKSTVHAALQWLSERKIVTLEPGPVWTEIWVIRFRREPVSRTRAHPLIAGPDVAEKVSPHDFGDCHKSGFSRAIARLMKKVADPSLQ